MVVNPDFPPLSDALDIVFNQKGVLQDRDLIIIYVIDILLVCFFVGKKQQSPFEVGEDEARKCPFEIWERNPAFPPLSDALGIAFNQEGGRHICATRKGPNHNLR